MKFSKMPYTIMSGIFLFLGCFALANPKAVGYHLLKKVPLGGGGPGREYYDYISVDASARRVYLSHGTEIVVIDADNSTVVGRVSDLKKIHGIALVIDIGRGFASDGGNSRVAIFDLKTLKTVGEVKTGGEPDCIIYDPASKRIFTFDGKTNDSIVIDPKTGTVVGTIPLGGHPEYAVADNRGMIYDNIMDKNEVVAIDSHALTVKSRWPIAPAGTPTALTMDREHRRLFIGGRNKILAVMDADNGNIVQTLPISDGVDANVYEPSTHLVFSSTRAGAIHIFREDSPDSFSAVQTIRTEPGRGTMGLDQKTHKIFTDATDFGPPPPTAEEPNPAPVPILGTFRLLIYTR